MIQETIFGAEKDTLFMARALEQARIAFEQNEVPIGAVVVNPQGEVVGAAFNTVEQTHTQTAHAECRAIQEAGASLNDWRLEGCWIYVTLEPCSMCMHLILLSRLAGVVFGASSPLFGFHLDNGLSIELYKKSTLTVVQGVCKEQAGELLKQFFKMKRNHKEVD
jgi:tRNA(adenine34) deaminase